MSSELEVLKQRIIELEAENAEIPDLRRKISEFDAERVDLRRKLSVSDAEIAELKRSNNEFLRANKEYNERRDAENAKLKAKIEELESENIEVRDRLTKVEQKQSQNDITPNDNTPNNNSSNFNSGAVHLEKSSEEKEMDYFLDEEDKKIVGEDIRRRNKEKKLQRESAKNQALAVTSVDSKLSRDKKTVTIGNDQDLKLSLNTGDNISTPSSIEDNLSCDTKMITCTDSEDAPPDEMSGPIATQPLDRNQVTEQTLKHELSRPISSVASVELHDESILNNAIEGSTQRLAYWIDEAIRMGLKEILCFDTSKIGPDDLPKSQVSVPSATSRTPIPRTDPNKMECLYQYAVEHGLDPEKFSIVTGAEKHRWSVKCFRGDLDRDILIYRRSIEKNDDRRKYHTLLTDRERMIGEELLRRDILKHRSSTAWLDDLMKEWEKTHTQFIQVFGQAIVSVKA
ncbi:unnamed protein product [Rhizophagus irregularis]|nr:unnamed protein product [Rhizophagus irregularis]